jgi:hypothetical protein
MDAMGIYGKQGKSACILGTNWDPGRPGSYAQPVDIGKNTPISVDHGTETPYMV